MSPVKIIGESDSVLAPVRWSVSVQGVASVPVSLAASGSAVAINDDGRIAGWSGPGSIATVWNDATPATLFTTATSQAFGLNNEFQPLVVGRNGDQGFVKRVNYISKPVPPVAQPAGGRKAIFLPPQLWGLRTSPCGDRLY